MERELVVTRHKGVIEWLHKHSCINQNTEIVERLDDEIISSLSPHDIVYGVLPLHLVMKLLSKNIRVYIVQFPQGKDIPRGAELSADEMDQYEAKLYWLGMVVTFDNSELDIKFRIPSDHVDLVQFNNPHSVSFEMLRVL